MIMFAMGLGFSSFAQIDTNTTIIGRNTDLYGNPGVNNSPDESYYSINPTVPGSMDGTQLRNETSIYNL